MLQPNRLFWRFQWQ